MGTGGDLVEVGERGGKRYPPGTVYYSKEAGGFLAAGAEEEGVLSLSQVSGRVTYSIDSKGVARFRDETGVFVKTSIFLRSAGTQFHSGLIEIQEYAVSGNPVGQNPGLDGQFVERITILKENGQVEVVEINHGIGNTFNTERQGKQWWRKMREALGEEGKKLTSSEMQAFVVTREVILRENLGPAGGV